MSERPLFSVTNHHVDSSGQPPHITDAAPHSYLGYFENSYGEQAIFVYDRETQKAVLYIGDAGWDHPYEVKDGQVPDLVMNSQERMWLQACWAAATEFTPHQSS